jgi:hypothetical protein
MARALAVAGCVVAVSVPASAAVAQTTTDAAVSPRTQVFARSAANAAGLQATVAAYRAALGA